MTVKRYDFGTEYRGNTGVPAIVGKVDGRYVRYEDYAALLAKVEAIRAGGVSGQRLTSDHQRMGEPVAWENFPGYLIDRCEGDIITEEGLQRALAAMLRDPQYSVPHPAEPVAHTYPTDEWVEEFFGNPDESGFYYFRGDFGNIAYRYQKAAKYAAPQPAEPVKVPSSFPTGTKYSVEPHGSGYAIYQGRGNFHHGLNLAHLNECTPEFSKRIESALNATSSPVKVLSDDEDYITEFLSEHADHNVEHGRMTFDKWSLRGAVRALIDRYGDIAPQPDEPAKVPSDKEILGVWSEVYNQAARSNDGHRMAFARALLARYGNQNGQHTEPAMMPSDEELGMLFGMWGWPTRDGRELRFSHFKEMVQILLARYGRHAKSIGAPTAVTACCGRAECGGECGNDWRGMVTVIPEGWQLIPSEPTEMPNGFGEWFAKNYPGPETIIHDPSWHAPRVWRAAICHTLKAAHKFGEEE